MAAFSGGTASSQFTSGSKLSFSIIPKSGRFFKHHPAATAGTIVPAVAIA